MTVINKAQLKLERRLQKLLLKNEKKKNKVGVARAVMRIEGVMEQLRKMKGEAQ